MSNIKELDLGPLHDYYEFEHAVSDFKASVIEGLSSPQKKLSSKYFYDVRGSQLFDKITELPEYYLSRTETDLLRIYADEFAELIGEGSSLIEFGSGSSTKVRILLNALQSPTAYVPIDISREHLIQSAKELAVSYPDLPVVPICADYTRPIKLPFIPNENSRAGFFPGSTIGNFTYQDAVKFLRTVANDLGSGNGLLIGVDLKKDVKILRAAYNDAAGVTAEFNLNILRHINRALGVDMDPNEFTHDALWNHEKGRIEMHLVSKCNQTVYFENLEFEFIEGESIHTENSHKYTIEGFQSLAALAGWEACKYWKDSNNLYSIHYLRVV